MNIELKTAWAAHAQAKQITARDMITYTILRAIFSKAEDKKAVAMHLLHKAFTPITRPSRLANGAEPFQIFSLTNAKLYKPEFLGVELTQEQFELYNEIYAEIVSKPETMVRHYSYFFTRQDICPEYQLVQTAHAALELGNLLTPEQVKNLHFSCIGVPNEHHLTLVAAELTALGHRFVEFREPDIGNEVTAIGVYPIAEHKRGNLRAYPRLRFQWGEGEKIATIQKAIKPYLKIKEIK